MRFWPLRELYPHRTPDAEALLYQAPQTPEEKDQPNKFIQEVNVNQRLTKDFNL
jgi:hypothetical protein